MSVAEKLAQAEAAYHALMTGEAVRVWQDQNGERVEYTVANAPRLSAYIEQLRAAASATASSRRPMGVTF